MKALVLYYSYGGISTGLPNISEKPWTVILLKYRP